uniref:CSON010801 protein n=1 Tax=Culicoides sonorensis TaxID=179676 RepID=A0A336N191_CULSO
MKVHIDILHIVLLRWFLGLK